jgi:hypothetical protein
VVHSRIVAVVALLFANDGNFVLCELATECTVGHVVIWTAGTAVLVTAGGAEIVNVLVASDNGRNRAWRLDRSVSATKA